MDANDESEASSQPSFVGLSDLEHPQNSIPSITTFSSMGRSETRHKEVANLLAVRKAAAVAVGSTSSMISILRHDADAAPNVGRCARLYHQLKELECFILAAEQKLLDKVLIELNHAEKVRTVFDLIDVDGNGINARELAEAFRLLEGWDTTMDQCLPMAQEAIATFATHKGRLTILPFEKFLEWLMDIMECSFNEVLFMLIYKIVFSQDGRSILEEFARQIGDENETDDGFVERILEARLLLVFETMDFYQDGVVCFKEAAKHLSRFTAEVMNPEQRNLLLMHEATEQRNLTMEQFIELVLNITAASSTPLESHEIANAMTLSICRQDVSDEDIKDLFLNREAFQDALADDEEDDIELEDIVSFGKLVRLFDSLDLSKDGYLDVTEVALFLRKYQPASMDMAETLQETIDSIEASDQDGDRKLNRSDFAHLITKLAHSTQMEIHRFIDFLVVQTVLKDDSAKDIRYLRVHREMRKNARQQRRGSLQATMTGIMVKAKTVSMMRRMSVSGGIK